tara:strand:- start:2237 stop:3562 length:1326 start_codon:yes stop_codon:yes gene_type:complete
MTLIGKKRKLDGADCEQPNSHKTILSQKYCDSSRILCDVYQNLEMFSDVTVLINPDDEETEAARFKCNSAILAACSDVFKAMLFGEMAYPHARPNRATDNRVLKLEYCSAKCFELMLRFIHSQEIKLDIWTALDLYSFADYYAVLPLCKTCIDYLKICVHVMNASSVLHYASASNCKEVEKMCMSILTLEFGRVVDFDTNFATIEPEIMHEIVQRDDLGCSGELNLIQALFKWHSHIEERNSWLLKMLQHVRWVNVSPQDCADILSDKRMLEIEGAEAHVQQLMAKPHAPACRRKTWGFLVAFNPAEPYHEYFEHVAPFPHNRSDEKVFLLDSNCDIVIGRSRSTDIRVGYKQQLPYVSSKHFSVHFIFDHTSTDEDEPVVKAVLKDLSQNGTFVNGHRIGMDNTHDLKDGDKIEMVFAISQSSDAVQFPHFVFNTHYTSD